MPAQRGRSAAAAIKYDLVGMLVAAGVILLLIALTALYVAAEFAAVGARRSRLRRLAEDGNPLAARILPVLDVPRELDRYIAASQVGITLSSLILGAYARAILAPWAVPLVMRWTRLDEHTALELSAGILLVALTVLSVILGELVPKAIALQYPTQTALFTVLPMQWSLRAYAWLIALLNGSARGDSARAPAAKHRPSTRPLSRRDCAPHRGKPRRGTARAAGAGQTASGAAPRTAQRAAAHGAA